MFQSEKLGFERKFYDMNIGGKRNNRRAFSLSIFLLIFMLSSQARAQERVKIALWGDSRENRNGACEDIADILLYRITDWDFQIHTGDFTQNGSESSWERSLGYEGVRSLLIPGRFFMCTSNHDYYEGDPLSDDHPYNRNTAGVLPRNTANGTTHFYYHRQGNVHIVACDAYFTEAGLMNSWLDSVLANIPEEDWLIGFWHVPCYGDITYKESYLDKCGPWLEKFHAHGGDFILHGHAHVYLRTHPLLPNGTVDHENGMVHIINGCGGATWKKPQKYTEKTAFTPDTRSFACLTFITIEGNTALIQTVDARPGRNFEVIDEWEWVKNP